MWCAWLAPIVLVQAAGAGSAPPQAPAPAGISLSPSVVMLSGRAGQAHRQTLRLSNHTAHELNFVLVAQDVVADGGRRVFVDAGARPDSVAATAVFSPAELTVPPGGVGTAEMTLTVPAGTRVRGVAAIFRGRTVVGSRGGVAMIASLGCLVTLTLSGDARLEAAPPEVAAQTATTPLTLSEWVVNGGAEPVVAGGAVAVVDAAGQLVGRVAVEPQRLLPGERLPFKAEYPGRLRPGRYRAVFSLEYDAQVLTNAVDFDVAADGDRHAAGRDAGDRR